MGVGSAVFETAGKRTEHVVPGVYSRSYNVTSASGVSAGNLCILGSSNGGKPLTLMEFGSVADAKNSLVGGELLEAVAYAFNGSKDFIPQKVFAMRVNEGEASALELKDGDSTIVTLKAWDYGAHTNQLKMKIEDGTTTGSKKITLAYKDKTSEIDNVIKPSFSIVCTDDEANGTITITKDNLVLSYVDGETPKSVTIAFEDFPKLSDVIARIEDEEIFVVSQIDTDENSLASDLDFVSAKSIATNTVIYSNRKAFIDALESCEFIGSVTPGPARKIPEDMTYTYFTGGSSSASTIPNWVSALETLEVEDIQIIATPSTDSDVQSLIATHCTQMSTTVNRKERTCILGGALNETDDNAISMASGLNNKLVSYVTDNAICSNPLTGATETVNGAMVAVMLAGMESAMAVNQPLTNKTLNVLGFTKKRTITNLEKLIKAGILVCNASPDNVTNYVCIRGLTTYQSDDLISNERSMVREDLFMNRDLRKAYTGGIGKPNNASPATIKATLKMKAKEWADLGYIVPDDSNNNVWNESVKIDGDKIYLTYSRYLTAPTNFIFITATNHIYTSTVEV